MKQPHIEDKAVRGAPENKQGETSVRVKMRVGTLKNRVILVNKQLAATLVREDKATYEEAE